MTVFFHLFSKVIHVVSCFSTPFFQWLNNVPFQGCTICLFIYQLMEVVCTLWAIMNNPAVNFYAQVLCKQMSSVPGVEWLYG